AIEPLPDDDERRNHRLTRPEFLGDPCTEMRGGDTLRRLVACVPVELVAGVQDFSEIGGGMNADERTAIHDLADVLQTGRKATAIESRRARLESREDIRRRHA